VSDFSARCYCDFVLALTFTTVYVCMCVLFVSGMKSIYPEVKQESKINTKQTDRQT